MPFLSELRRRNVFKVGAAYLVAAWLVIQVAETVFPLFGFDDTPARIVVVVFAIGFVPALIFSWVFELTPDGLKKEKDVVRSESITPETGRKLDRLVIVVLVLALGYFSFDKFIIDPVRDKDRVARAREEGRAEANTRSYADRSIAVLAFEDMSPQKDQEYLSDGIAEELLNLLARVPSLRVISRSSAFSFKGKDVEIPEIAERLNVNHVLEGSVRKAGDRVRITVQLLDARTDTHLWSETYDRTLGDIFAIQDEIAGSVVAELKLQLLGQNLTVPETDPGAYALYLQGGHLMSAVSTDSLKEAVNRFQQALEIDPDFSPAWLRLGATYDRMGSVRLLPVDKARDLSFTAIERALALDPDSADVLNAFAWRLFKHQGDPRSAAVMFERALVADPRDTNLIGNIAIFLGSIGRLEDSIAFSKYQIVRDPANSVAHNNIGIRYRYFGMPDKAIEHFETAGTLNPTFAGLQYEIGAAYLQIGEIQEAARAFEKESIVAFRQIGLSMAQYASGEIDNARALLDNVVDEFGDAIPYYIAVANAYQEDSDAAFKWLLKARELVDSALTDIINEPLAASLRGDSRWLPFLESLDKSPRQLEEIQFTARLPDGEN